MNKIISQTENGQVFRCSKCNLIHFEYKNINFNFTEKEYNYFAKYFLELDGAFWEFKNDTVDNYFKRKIFVPAGHDFNIILNNEELLELKDLFSKPFRKLKIPLDMFNSNFNNN